MTNSLALTAWVVLWSAHMGHGALQPAETHVPLSALMPDCSLSRDAIAEHVPVGRPDALWLTCSGVKFVVVHPDNLVGKVDIRSPNQAVQFVRLFTSLPTFASVRLGGCVELADTGDPSLFYVVEPRTFNRYLKNAQVEQQGQQATKDLSFIIKRPVVCPDQKVYVWEEQVESDGLYFQLSQKVVLKSARNLGITHWVH
jgi:hypothetical protein